MMEQVLAVQRMQDYIEENLDQKITLSDLAQVSHFSPWYSYRLFRDHLAVTPAEYIRKLRLSRAALCLRDENCRITDVPLLLASAVWMGLQEHFSAPLDATPAITQKPLSPFPFSFPTM